ncbi:MAG: chemotaxis protein CheA [bacterium]|nr:chemotaxis protein CheA [bacterium]
MINLTQIAEEVLLLSPGDASAKKVASMLAELSKQNGLSAEIRKCATDASQLAKKLATKKSTAADLQALLGLLSKLEDMETATAPTSVSNELVAEYLASQDSVLDDFEELAMGLVAQGEQGFRALKRQVHTWKGELGIIGADSLAKSLHSIEDSLDGITKDAYQNVCDAMLDLKDSMAECFKALREGRQPILETDKVLALLVQAPETIAAPPAPVPVVEVVQPAVVVVEQAPLAPTTEPTKTQDSIPFEQRKAELHSVVDGNFLIPDGVDVELVGEFRTEAEEHFQNIEVGLMNLESTPDDMESVNTVFRAFHTVKGVASFVGVNYITELAHKGENLLDRVRKGTLTLEGPFLDLAFESMDLVRRMVQTLTDAIAEGKYAVPKNYASLLYRLEHPEEVLENFRANGGVIVKQEEEIFEDGTDGNGDGESETTGQQQSDPAVNAEQKPGTPKAEGQSSSGAVTDATVKVNMSRLDSLINMVGELVISQAMVSQDPDILLSANRKLTQNVAQLAKITRSLQELALSMRMVSVKATFQKMARLVRDVARKSNKIVEFEMSGEETELDRNMVEAIADPLVHMVRNAVDHGVEPPETRLEVGKTRHGVVHLSAAHEGGSVLITLTDDGRGLNREKILSKAIERGIIEPNAVMTDKEIYNLIFLPGFSTADKITDVSGRGVGMDVVRTNIEKLRGSVEIDSTPGHGSIFRIRLPLTLAIIDGMVIKTGSQRFIIPTIAITESFRPQQDDIVTVHGRGEMVKLRGHLLPVSRLHSVFGVVDAGTKLSDSILIVAEAKSRRIAIMADALVGQQQVVIKSLGHLFEDMDGVAGCAILGDGRISLILDIEGILSVSQKTYPAYIPAAAETTA